MVLRRSRALHLEDKINELYITFIKLPQSCATKCHGREPAAAAGRNHMQNNVKCFEAFSSLDFTATIFFAIQSTLNVSIEARFERSLVRRRLNESTRNDNSAYLAWAPRGDRERQNNKIETIYSEQ